MNGNDGVQYFRKIVLFVSLLGLATPGRSAGALEGIALPTYTAASPGRRWQPVPDQVYLQEVGRKVSTPEALQAIAVFQGTVFTGSEKGLYRLEPSGDRLTSVAEVPGPVKRLVSTREALWAMTPGGLYRFQSGTWKKISDAAVADVAEHLGNTVAAIGKRLLRVNGDALEEWVKAECPFAIARIVPHSETLYVSGAGHLSFVDGQRFGGLDTYGFPADLGWDWGDLPSNNVRDVMSAGSGIYFATDRGLGLLRGMALTSIRGEQGLCYEDTTCLTRGFTNDVWIGTSHGAIRKVGDQYHYFAGQRWLPADFVNAIATDARTVYLATSQGLGIIEYQPYTLSAKAAFYEKRMEELGQKRLGFTHKLEWDEGQKAFVPEISDNDGGYSGNYLAAQSYRYAVTHDPEARREALKTFRALCWLQTMTGIPGYPARSVWVKGEKGHKAMHGSGGYDAEWHDTADGKHEWKGDTSSDELCSHFYCITLFLEHVAEGAEVQEAKEHLSQIAAHLIDHHWQLIDVDGKPTRWGRWDPEYFTTEEGRFDRGLQSLELLSFIRTSQGLTGNAKFGDAYQKLVDLGYPDYTLRQRQVFPPESVLHFEDELALWSYWNLLRFERDPKLRSIYRRSFERTYEVLRIEHNPWFNFVYGALTGNECEVDQAVNHLREWPLDLTSWSYQNSHRADLRTPSGYVSYKAGTRAFSPRETEPMRWDHWTMQADGGAGGRDVAEPGAWLLAYWMGRYHGFIGKD